MMNPTDLSFIYFALLYVGPDQMLPLVSTAGGVLGILLLWGRNMMNSIRRIFPGRSERTETAKE